MDHQLLRRLRKSYFKKSKTPPRWVFDDIYANKDRGNSQCEPLNRADTISHALRKNRPITVPNSWLLSKEEKTSATYDSVDTYDRAIELSLKGALSFCLGVLSSTRFIINAESDSKIDPCPPFPVPIVKLNDLPASHPHSIKRCFVNFLANACASSLERPLMDALVEILPGFLYVPGSSVSHNFPSPPSSLIFSAGRPTKLIESRLVLDGVHESLWPTITAAIPWDMRPPEEAAVELAKCLEWSLALMVILHACGPDPAPNKLPAWCVLFGTVFTPTGAIVYAHYPRWDARKQKWQQRSTQVATNHEEKLLQAAAPENLALVSALFILQRTAHETLICLKESLEKLEHKVDLASFSGKT